MPNLTTTKLACWWDSASRALIARPLGALVTMACIILFLLHAYGRFPLDSYAIVLLVLAALPWSIPALSTVVDAVGNMLVAANIKSLQIGGFKVEQIERKLDEQRRILDDLILYSMAFYIYEKLKYLHLGTLDPTGPYSEYKYVKDEPFDHDLRYLRDHGYLEHVLIEDLVPGENLVGRLKVTEMGKRFVNLKEGRGIGQAKP
jgi:hypothetical protein